MAFKLAIEDKVNVRVKGKLSGATAGSDIKFDFHLTCSRMEQDQITSAMKENGQTIAEFMLDRASGWSGQRLVLGDNDQPASFSKEAMAEMFKIPGMAVFCYRAYLNDVGAQEKN